MKFNIQTSLLKSVVKALAPIAKSKQGSYYDYQLSGKIAIGVAADAQEASEVTFYASTGNASARYFLSPDLHEVEPVESGFIAVDAHQLQEVISVVKTDSVVVSFDSEEGILYLNNQDTGAKIVQLAAKDADEAKEDDLICVPDFADEDVDFTIDSFEFKSVVDSLIPTSPKNDLWGETIAVLHAGNDQIRLTSRERANAFVYVRTVNAETRKEFDDIMLSVDFIKMVTGAIREAGDGELLVANEFAVEEKTTRFTLKQDGVIVLDLVIPEAGSYINRGNTGILSPRGSLEMMADIIAKALDSGSNVVTAQLPMGVASSEMADAVKIGELEPDYTAANTAEMQNINLEFCAEDGTVGISTDHNINQYRGLVEAVNGVDGEDVGVKISYLKMSDLLTAKFLGRSDVLNIGIIPNQPKPGYAIAIVLPEGVSVKDEDFTDNVGYGVSTVISE